MAFKGDLTNISLFDVFQTLNQNKQTGVLVLSKDGVTKKIHISPDGVSIFFTRSFRPLRLGEIFVRRGRITPQDVEILLLEQKKAYRPIGELMIELGKVAEEEVASVLRYHAEDEIFEIFSWESGHFSFYDGQEVGDATTPLSDILMDPASLCLEAARRLDEMERLREKISSNDEYFAQVEGVEPDPEQNSPAVCDLFQALSEPNSVDDLRDLVGLSLYDALTALVRLLDGGLIRPRDVDELLDAGRHARDVGQHQRAAKLFEKAHELDPGSREILEACVEAIERLGDPRRVAKYLANLGSICLDAGEIEEAVEYLEQTLRSDSMHFGALVALRDAFTQQGDTERVADMSLKIARVYAERGDLRSAVEACQQGLDTAPEAVALRLYYAQLLARTDSVEDARNEIYALIEDIERSGSTEKAHELLAGCYRLLLKIDPEDEEAKLGMRDIDRRRMSSMRRRKLFLRGGIAAALVMVLAGVGLTIRGANPSELQDQINQANQRHQYERALELIDQLLADHPESPEALAALHVQKEIKEKTSAVAIAKRGREKKLREEVGVKLDDVRTALTERPYLEALGPVQEFLTLLERAEVKFLHAKMSANIEYELVTFLDRVKKRFDEDHQQVTVAEVTLKQNQGKDAGELEKLEDRLALVRQRDWMHLIPDLNAALKRIATSRHIGKAKARIDEFRQKVESGQGVFTNLNSLYHVVRRERIRAEIITLLKAARENGKELVMDCEFDKARRLYDEAYRRADEVTDEEPRAIFGDLLSWLDARKIPQEMEAERDRIDTVVATLSEVDDLIQSDRADAAYRLLRDLVSEYRLIRFEKRYKMPYRVESMPAGAEVSVNGQAVGRTPCTISMTIGQKPVLVRLYRPGFEEQRMSLIPIDPKLGGTLEVALEKELAWDKEITGGGIEAPPVIVNGLVLLATTDASLLALRLKDGSRAWEAPTKLLQRITAKPVVAGNVAYLVTVNGVLHRVRLSDGKIVGRKRLREQVHHDPVFDGDLLYVATRKPSLLAIRGTKVVYSVPLARSPSTRLVLKNGMLCVGTAEGLLLVHDAKTGKEITKLRAPSGSSFFGGIATHGNLVLAGAEDGKLYAFDLKTRKRKWAFSTSGPIAAPAVSDKDDIYLGARDGYVHVLTPDGEKKTRFDVSYAVLAEPTIDNGFLYAIGSNRVKAFDTRSGHDWWDRSFGNEHPLHVVSQDGYIVVVTGKPWVHAFPKDVR